MNSDNLIKSNKINNRPQIIQKLRLVQIALFTLAFIPGNVDSA